MQQFVGVKFYHNEVEHVLCLSLTHTLDSHDEAVTLPMPENVLASSLTSS